MDASNHGRRAFLRGSAATAASVAAITAGGALPAAAVGLQSEEPGSGETESKIDRGPHQILEEATIAQMIAAMESGAGTSRQLIGAYLDRIAALDRGRVDLRSVITVNPRALELADERDQERKAGTVRGPLHGIPILLKDNIDTTDMATTVGSLALVDSQPAVPATLTTKLEEAGAIIIGKANMSEWANFRGSQSSSGWSAVGGACRNPYVLDRNPCGSSSGSGAAVSANLVAASLGTETDGSIVCPASANGIVGIKPSVGLTSRAGVVPISRTQDTIGPMARTVADAAIVLGVLTGVDDRDPATAESAGQSHQDYTTFLDPEGLDGARIGIARQLMIDSPETSAIMEQAVAGLAAHGAVVVDPVEFPSFEDFSSSSAEFDVLLLEFKTDLALYLETRVGGPKTLADVIAFNIENAETELKWFGQELLELSESRGGIEDPDYAPALAESRRISRTEGLDAVLDANNLDAIVAPTGSPAWPTDLVNGDHFLGGSSSYAAMAGYPLISVPMGQAFGLPVGISFMGGLWSEPTLIKLASGFEAKLGARTKPTFLSTLGR